MSEVSPASDVALVPEVAAESVAEPVAVPVSLSPDPPVVLGSPVVVPSQLWPAGTGRALAVRLFSLLTPRVCSFHIEIERSTKASRSSSSSSQRTSPFRLRTMKETSKSLGASPKAGTRGPSNSITSSMVRSRRVPLTV